jgi:uncharacterized membrane protein YphA (DoxX/SURF4 family)
MTLLRAAARTMLASYFVATGIKALRNPDPLVPLAEPLADKVVPLVKKYAPDEVAGYIPEDAKTLVRVNGAAQVLGGLALASGKGRRAGAWLLAGSLVPSTVAKHPFWSRTDRDEKAADRAHFLKNVSLLGGVLLAAGDTEGKPSLAWRAQKGGQSLAKSTKKATKKIGPSSSSISDTASDLAESALAGGATLVSAVVAGTRKARKEAKKQLKAASVVAAKQAEEGRKAAIAAARQAKKDAPRLAKAAKKLAAEQAEAARKAAAQARKDAPKLARAAELKAKADQKRAQLDEKLAIAAEKRAQKVRKNIKLGEN